MTSPPPAPPSRRPLWPWALAAFLALAIVSQCTPVPGCWREERTYSQGEHLGFSIGMTVQDALAVVRRRYDPTDVTVWTGGDDILFAKSPADIAAVDSPVQQWRFGQPKPVCWSSKRNVVLRFRDHRLAEIIDELSITLP
mgnify:CR=1 FL=1